MYLRVISTYIFICLFLVLASVGPNWLILATKKIANCKQIDDYDDDDDDDDGNNDDGHDHG